MYQYVVWPCHQYGILLYSGFQKFFPGQVPKVFPDAFLWVHAYTPLPTPSASLKV